MSSKQNQVKSGVMQNAVKNGATQNATQNGAVQNATKNAAQNDAAQSVAAADTTTASPALENQVGLGVDIVEIARMAAILKRTPRFKQRVFTAGEQEYCDKMASPEIHYATRFAAKEAVLKALGTGFSWGKCDPRHIEVCRNTKGRPYVVLHGSVKKIAQNQQISEIPISLSYTHTEAVACAMAITSTSTAPVQEKDPMAELSQQFKELRTLLDEVDTPQNNGEGLEE